MDECPNMHRSDITTKGNVSSNKRRLRTKVRHFSIWQTVHVRRATISPRRTHHPCPSIEFSLDNADVGSLLEEKIGITSSCWEKQSDFETSRFNEKKNTVAVNGQNSTTKKPSMAEEGSRIG